MPFTCANSTDVEGACSMLLKYCNNHFGTEKSWCNCIDDEYSANCGNKLILALSLGLGIPALIVICYFGIMLKYKYKLFTINNTKNIKLFNTNQQNFIVKPNEPSLNIYHRQTPQDIQLMRNELFNSKNTKINTPIIKDTNIDNSPPDYYPKFLQPIETCIRKNRTTNLEPMKIEDVYDENLDLEKDLNADDATPSYITSSKISNV